MSIQYANKKIAEFQKAICLWEVKKIHAITSNKTKKIELEVECSENNKTFKGIKVNGEETGCQDFLKDIEIPKTCAFKVENITNAHITNTKYFFDFTDYNGFNKEHLWEIYTHKRKRIITGSFLCVFIVTVLTTLIISLCMLKFQPVKPDSKVCCNRSHEISGDTLIIKDTIIIKNELIADIIKKKVTLENSNENKIILSDTTLFTKNRPHLDFADSSVYVRVNGLKNNFKTLYNSGIIEFIVVLSFLIINTIISLLLIHILLKRLIIAVFGESSSKYLDPDIDLH